MHLFVAVPAYNGSMLVETTQSIFQIQEMVHARGGRFQFDSRLGAPVSLVRNALTAAFLMSDADMLLMIDADQGVHPDTIGRMIDLDQPVVGAFYPKRTFDWDAVKLPVRDMSQALRQAARFVGQLLTDDNGRAEIIGGFGRAAYVGTGVLLVRRDAFHRLMERYPDLQGSCLHVEAWPELAPNGGWGFFNPMNNDAGAPLAEDISFSLRWRRMGGEIWAEVTSPIAHIGHWTFEGAYFDHVQAFN